jgi:hypothetical protein
MKLSRIIQPTSIKTYLIIGLAFAGITRPLLQGQPGTEDAGFARLQMGGRILSLARQNDGKIWVSEWVSQFGATPRS